MLPIILPTLPLLGVSFLADHTYEHVFLIITAIIGSIAMFSGFKRYHRKLYPFYLLALGVIIYWQKHDFSVSLQPYFIIVGAFLIIAAHFLNLKLCKDCATCPDRECN
jgi:Ca2+/Na+ antiporter